MPGYSLVTSDYTQDVSLIQLYMGTESIRAAQKKIVKVTEYGLQSQTLNTPITAGSSFVTQRILWVDKITVDLGILQNTPITTLTSKN